MKERVTLSRLFRERPAGERTYARVRANMAPERRTEAESAKATTGIARYSERH